MHDHPWNAIALFAFVSSITPGPNNLLATSSGARFGLMRTLPQVAGVTAGFTLLLWLSAFGVGNVIVAYPMTGMALAIAGYAYLSWMSLRLLMAASSRRPRSKAPTNVATLRPMTLLQAALFQFWNPKAWMMAISAASSFLGSGERPWAAIATLCLLFAIINFPCVSAWAAMGAHLQRWLLDPLATWRMRAFDASMGLAMLVTTGWMVASR